MKQKDLDNRGKGPYFEGHRYNIYQTGCDAIVIKLLDLKKLFWVATDHAGLHP